jgi:hypothetical protein
LASERTRAIDTATACFCPKSVANGHELRADANGSVAACLLQRCRFNDHRARAASIAGKRKRRRTSMNHPVPLHAACLAGEYRRAGRILEASSDGRLYYSTCQQLAQLDLIGSSNALCLAAWLPACPPSHRQPHILLASRALQKPLYRGTVQCA